MSDWSDAELALKKRFEDVYARSVSPVMLEIEREVCGCDYGGNSWTTREQADDLIRLLGLNGESRLVDLGAGSGWPALYLSNESGCDITLIDLPEIGLQLAEQRARVDGFNERVSTLVADAADLPFPDASFDAISHSDLLCCLVRKQDVLMECRRILEPNGHMAFTVISIAPGLSPSDYSRALANGPDFIAMDGRYEKLLDSAGWAIDQHIDLTADYEESCARQLDADLARMDELAELFGKDEIEERIASWRSKLSTIREGLFLRELFLCKPSSER